MSIIKKRIYRIKKKFTKINESFECENCAQKIKPAEKTCRNHCPFCLHSKHVDINPGDRLHACKGLMQPIGYQHDTKKGLQIIYKCTKCEEVRKNIALLEDKIQADDYQAILKLSGKTPY